MNAKDLPTLAQWPKDWRNVPLWALFDRIKNVGHSNEEMLSVFRSHGVIKKSSLHNNNQTAENRDIYQLISEGWFIVNRMKAWQGSVGISPLRGIVSGHYICFRPRHDEDPRFLNWLLRSDVYAVEYARMSRGVRPGQIEIDNDELRGLRIALPPLDEQRRIADFLDSETTSIDKIQSATDEQLSLLKSLRIEALRSMTTGTVGNRTTSDTRVAWMPSISADWQLFKIGLCFRTGSGTTPRSNDDRFFNGPINWINTGDLRDGLISETARTVSDLALKEYPTLRVYPVGTLMVAMYGATIGRAGINKIPACVNQACCALESLGTIDVTYAFYWFCAHRAEILRLGSGGGQPNISQELIRSLRIPAPDSLQTQRDIAGECRIIDEEINNRQMMLLRRVDLLSERRQALITAAVTGQFDVTTAGGLVSAGGTA